MATRFSSSLQWSTDSTIYAQGDLLVAVPEGFSGVGGVFRFKRCNGVTPARLLPWAPNSTYFIISGNSAGSGVFGPTTTVAGYIPLWGGTTGHDLTGGIPTTTFASAAQGTLASTALQPGSLLTLLSSGVAGSGTIPVANGSGGIAWASPAGGGTVTSVGLSGGTTGLTFAGSPITGSGTMTAGGTLALANGGTGATTAAGARSNLALGTLATQNGTFSGTSSGTNTGDQFTSIAASTLLGRGSIAGAGAAESITLGSGLTMTGTVLSASGGGTGDVVGPAAATDSAIALYNGTTGKLIKDGPLRSTGGNGTSDSGKVPTYNTDGQLRGSSTVGFSYAIQGTATGFGQAGYFTAVDGKGIDVTSATGRAGSFTTGNEICVAFVNNSATQPNLDVTQSGAGDVAHFDGPSGGVHLLNDGGMSWGSATGAQTTASNLPVFGALTKGVVPAAGAVPSASNFLTETGTFAIPAGTGITALTGDATASGPGSAALTLATVNGNVGSFGSATQSLSITANAKGLITAISAQTVTPAIGSVSGLGANVATFLATPSSANLAAAITDEMSGGTKLAFGDNGTEVAYTGTDTYTAGGQPSGASNKRQFYTQVGNQVTWQISITWANTSTTCTNVTLTFPTQFPTPAIPTGFTGASVKLYQCYPVRCITTPSGTITNGTTHMIVRNAADTGFEISGAGFASGSYRTFIFGGTYFTA